MKKYFKLLILMMLVIPFTTGCTNDNMEDIEIVVTNYPNEYIVEKLYSEYSTISSIYPDGVDINNYKISSKQKKDYAKKDLFIYNGLIEKERNLAIDLLSINPNLKIIDAAYVLETDYSPEELWLNPSSLLMMAQNVRLGLQEYITSSYLKKEVDANYDGLKVELSELDAKYRVDVENTDNKTIVVANSALKYLEKFGIEVICIDNDATAKTLSVVNKLIEDKAISYVTIFKNDKLPDNAKKIISEHSEIKESKLHKLDNISDEDRSEGRDYISIMEDNLEIIKQELYQ